MVFEHQTIIMGRVSVDGLGQILHARCPELLAKDFDHAPHRLPGPLTFPNVLEQCVVTEELIWAAGKPFQQPERQRVSKVAALAAPTDTEGPRICDRLTVCVALVTIWHVPITRKTGGPVGKSGVMGNAGEGLFSPLEHLPELGGKVQ
jgi:hypothetical protein